MCAVTQQGGFGAARPRALVEEELHDAYRLLVLDELPDAIGGEDQEEVVVLARVRAHLLHLTVDGDAAVGAADEDPRGQQNTRRIR